jgi:hypothetical protein
VIGAEHGLVVAAENGHFVERVGRSDYTRIAQQVFAGFQGKIQRHNEVGRRSSSRRRKGRNRYLSDEVRISAAHRTTCDGRDKEPDRGRANRSCAVGRGALDSRLLDVAAVTACGEGDVVRDRATGDNEARAV